MNATIDAQIATVLRSKERIDRLNALTASAASLVHGRRHVYAESFVDEFAGCRAAGQTCHAVAGDNNVPVAREPLTIIPSAYPERPQRLADEYYPAALMQEREPEASQSSDAVEHLLESMAGVREDMRRFRAALARFIVLPRS
eukprot:m51a1_g7314 hypothetical protein (143) ;mRNA; f:134519-135266